MKKAFYSCRITSYYCNYWSYCFLMGFPSLQRMLNDNATKEIEIYGRSMISAAKMYMQKRRKRHK